MKRKTLSLILVLALCSALLAGCATASAVSQAHEQAVLTNLAHREDTPAAHHTLTDHSSHHAATQNAPAAPAEATPTTPVITPTACDICGEYDCDDGAYCDDWDEKLENQLEAQNRPNGTPCEVCGEYDCDDGAYCDDWDEKLENQLEAQNRPNGTPCEVCGEYDCDDGAYCDDWDDRREHRHGHR